MRIEESIRLPLPRSAAWAELVCWEKQASWMKDADRVEVRTEAREGVGVLIAVKTRLFNIPVFTERLEVVEWEPPGRLVMAHRTFVRGSGEWTLEGEGDFSCLFRWVEDVRIPPPVLGDIAVAVYRPFMRRLMKGSLLNLAESLSG